MSDESKKMDLDDLDLSDLGVTVTTEDPVEEVEQELALREGQEVSDGIWIFQRPIENVNHDELVSWINEKLPATSPEGFKKSTFSTLTKKTGAVNRVLQIYSALAFLNQATERPKTYVN